MAVLLINGDKSQIEKDIIITNEVIPKLISATSSVEDPMTSKKRQFKEISSDSTLSLPAIRFDRVGYKEW